MVHGAGGARRPGRVDVGQQAPVAVPGVLGVVGHQAHAAPRRQQPLRARALASGPKHWTGSDGSRVSGVSMPIRRTVVLEAARPDLDGVAVDDARHVAREGRAVGQRRGGRAARRAPAPTRGAAPAGGRRRPPRPRPSAVPSTAPPRHRAARARSAPAVMSAGAARGLTKRRAQRGPPPAVRHNLRVREGRPWPGPRRAHDEETIMRETRRADQMPAGLRRPVPLRTGRSTPGPLRPRGRSSATASNSASWTASAGRSATSDLFYRDLPDDELVGGHGDAEVGRARRVPVSDELAPVPALRRAPHRRPGTTSTSSSSTESLSRKRDCLGADRGPPVYVGQSALTPEAPVWSSTRRATGRHGTCRRTASACAPTSPRAGGRTARGARARPPRPSWRRTCAPAGTASSGGPEMDVASAQLLRLRQGLPGREQPS